MSETICPDWAMLDDETLMKDKNTLYGITSQRKILLDKVIRKTLEVLKNDLHEGELNYVCTSIIYGMYGRSIDNGDEGLLGKITILNR